MQIVLYFNALIPDLKNLRILALVPKELGKEYKDINLIIAHLGSGISIGLHKKGKIVDVNNAIAGEDPFSPERSGGIPVGTYLKYVFDNKLNFQDALKMLYVQGGIYAYLGTNDFQEAMEGYTEGNNKKVKLVIDAMAYGVVLGLRGDIKIHEYSSEKNL